MSSLGWECWEVTLLGRKWQRHAKKRWTNQFSALVNDGHSEDKVIRFESIKLEFLLTSDLILSTCNRAISDSCDPHCDDWFTVMTTSNAISQYRVIYLNWDFSILISFFDDKSLSNLVSHLIRLTFHRLLQTHFLLRSSIVKMLVLTSEISIFFSFKRKYLSKFCF